LKKECEKKTKILYFQRSILHNNIDIRKYNIKENSKYIIEIILAEESQEK
jgi:hypothetical protein